jgi:hypothetical protein
MTGTSKLSSLLASIATQVQAAIVVGVQVDDTGLGENGTERSELTLGPFGAQLWDDAPGRMTRNGLGSLEIGAGKTQVDE